jgi:hypothetical protein
MYDVPTRFPICTTLLIGEISRSHDLSIKCTKNSVNDMCPTGSHVLAFASMDSPLTLQDLPVFVKSSAIHHCDIRARWVHGVTAVERKLQGEWPV